MAVVPKNNLPPESQDWARKLERRIADLETRASNLDTMVSGSNARIGTLVNTTSTLDGAVGSLGDAVDFLGGQFDVSTSGPTQSIFGSTNTYTPTDVWEAYYPTLDASLQFTTPKTGHVVAQVSSFVASGATRPASGTNIVITRTFVSFDVVDASGTVVIPPGNSGAYLRVDIRGNSLGEQGDVFEYAEVNSAGAWSGALGGLSPNTSYTIRTRRGYGHQCIGTNHTSTSSFMNASVAILKVGI